MSTPLVPETPNANTTPTGSPPSSTPPAGSTGNATATPEIEWRAPEGSRWAGRTAKEILGITDKLYDVVEKFNQQSVVQPQAPPPRETLRYEQPSQEPADSDYVDGATLKRYMQQSAQQYVNPQIEEVQRQTGSLAYGLIKDKYRDAFRAYGPEIESVIARLPLNLRTLEYLENAVNFVQGQHLNELVEQKAEARARELAAQMPSGLRSTGTPSGAPSPADTSASVQNEALPAEWRAKAAKVGLTDAVVRDFCRANEMTPEQFFKQFEGNVMTDKAVANVRV